MMKVSVVAGTTPFTKGTEITEEAPQARPPYDLRGLCVELWKVMRIAYLECFSGISGDMFLGALVDAGVSPRLLEETVAAHDVGAKLEISRVIRCGISATKV